MKVPPLFLLLSFMSVQAQDAPAPDSSIATLLRERGVVVILRDGKDESKDSTGTGLNKGDYVSVSDGGKAILLYNDPPPLELGEGKHLVLSREADGISEHGVSEASMGSLSLWGTIRRFMVRLTGGEVEGTPEVVVAAERGPAGGELALALPETSRALDRHPSLSWWPASSSSTSPTYELAVVGGADPARCWKGGDVLWEASTQDTVWVYPDEAPALTPGPLYRVELWTADGGGDFACFDIADETEQARLMEGKDALDRSIANAGPATREVLWTSVLIEQGYSGQAWNVLDKLLRDHPDHATAQALRHFLIKQATQ